MKNNRLLYACVVAALAGVFTSCEPKSNVMDICGDLLKETMYKSPARSMMKVDGLTTYFEEYELVGGQKEQKMVRRTLTFGDKVYVPQQDENLSFQYGEWGDKNTSFSLYVTPETSAPYTLWYQNNAFKTPAGTIIGGDGTNLSARIERMESTMKIFPNTEWAGEFKGEFVLDSAFKDSVYNVPIPFPPFFKQETKRVFAGRMDTVSADTTCRFELVVNRDPVSFENTGVYTKVSCRWTYDRDAKAAKLVSKDSVTIDYHWTISDFTSPSKFTVLIQDNTSEEQSSLSISKFDMEKTKSLLLGGVTYKLVEP